MCVGCSAELTHPDEKTEQPALEELKTGAAGHGQKSRRIQVRIPEELAEVMDEKIYHSPWLHSRSQLVRICLKILLDLPSEGQGLHSYEKLQLRETYEYLWGEQ